MDLVEVDVLHDIQNKYSAIEFDLEERLNKM